MSEGTGALAPWPSQVDPELDAEGLLSSLCGDLALVRELSEAYQQQRRDWAAALLRATREESAEAVFRIAHLIRGALLTIQARGAARLAQQVEEAASCGASDRQLRPLAVELSSRMERVELELQSLCRGVR